MNSAKLGSSQDSSPHQKRPTLSSWVLPQDFSLQTMEDKKFYETLLRDISIHPACKQLITWVMDEVENHFPFPPTIFLELSEQDIKGIFPSLLEARNKLPQNAESQLTLHSFHVDAISIELWHRITLCKKEVTRVSSTLSDPMRIIYPVQVASSFVRKKQNLDSYKNFPSSNQFTSSSRILVSLWCAHVFMYMSSVLGDVQDLPLLMKLGTSNVEIQELIDQIPALELGDHSVGKWLHIFLVKWCNDTNIIRCLNELSDWQFSTSDTLQTIFRIGSFYHDLLLMKFAPESTQPLVSDAYIGEIFGDKLLGKNVNPEIKIAFSIYLSNNLATSLPFSSIKKFFSVRTGFFSTEMVIVPNTKKRKHYFPSSPEPPPKKQKIGLNCDICGKSNHTTSEHKECPYCFKITRKKTYGHSEQECRRKRIPNQSSMKKPANGPSKQVVANKLE